MLILALKFRPGVDSYRVDSFIDHWIPVLEEPTRIGKLSSLKLYRSAHTGSRLEEFVLMIDGFVQAPALDGLERLCEILYSFECEERFLWPEALKG